jgi:hypothetical protein
VPAFPSIWIVAPEDRALIAYALDAGGYHAVFTAEGPDETSAKMRIPPFEAIEIDLGLLFGDLE